MIILLAIVAALVLIGLLARRSGRFTLPPAGQTPGRWWDQPAPVREPYEQGEQ